MAGPALTDVPDRYDVVFQLNNGNTYGFLFADSVESNLPFRTHKALYSYSPTFLERQNVSASYGDNFQDFFLTGTQADFSEGEQQKFFRVNDADSVRKYFSGQNVDPTSVPGNVTLTQNAIAETTAANMNWIAGLGGVDLAGAGTTNSYSFTGQTLTNQGAHGLGGQPTCIGTDGSFYYISAPSGGSVGIRKLNSVFTASTFSSTKVDQLCFVNNILFGIQNSSGNLYSFDSSGNPTSQFVWKAADGTAGTNALRMVAFGGQIYILNNSSSLPASLWQYDGSGVNKLADLPIDFLPTDMCISQGIAFISGGITQNQSGAKTYKPQIYYYANGAIGKLWEAEAYGTTSVVNGTYVDTYGNGIIFQDATTNKVYVYDIALGGVHCIANPGAQIKVRTSALSSLALFGGIGGATTSYVYPPDALTYNSSGYIQTSQYDFDNTLTKIFRGIKVDVDIPANTSVDIAYQLDGCGGSYTTLQTSVTSGTEYFLPASTSGHSISVQVTLKSATGSATPTLKHVYVRAAPLLQQFRRREFLFDLSSGERDEVGKVSRRTRDLSPYPVDAITACNNLATIATQAVPFTLVDRFTGSTGMTVLADLEQNQEGYDGFAIYEIRPNVFIGRINLREV